MSEAAGPLVDHELVLADKYRDADAARELVLDVPQAAVERALLDSDVYLHHTEYGCDVDVAVLTPAGHLTVKLYPHDGQTDRSVEEYFSPRETDGGDREVASATGVAVASAAAPERADAVLERVVDVVDDHNY